MAEVAKLLRVSRKTVEKLIYAKKLHAVKVGRVWRIPRAAVEAFLEGKEYREPEQALVLASLRQSPLPGPGGQAVGPTPGQVALAQGKEA